MSHHQRRHGRYHEIAADVLRSKRPSTAVTQLLEAAEAGNIDVCGRILQRYKGIVDSKCDVTGDTPLIAAARSQHKQVIDLLLSYCADCTLHNDNGETVLEVATPTIKKYILASLSRHPHLSEAQELLHSAWLGDAVSVNKSLSGNNMLSVNCRNSEGLTPLLLVTRDTDLFDKVHHVMATEYDPVKVMEQLLLNKSNISATDSMGSSALHLVAHNENVQAKRMVSLLLESGADTESMDANDHTPLHVASRLGHTAIVVALVEESNVDINQRGGDKRGTPLMLSATHGHKDTARYLLSQGADVTLKDDDGHDALALAKTPSLIAMIKDATPQKREGPNDHQTAPPVEHLTSIHPTEDSEGEEEEEEGDTPEEGEDTPEEEGDTPTLVDTPTLFNMPSNNTPSFFVTERQCSKSHLSMSGLDISSDKEETDCSTPDNLVMTPIAGQSEAEVEADDEQELGVGSNKRLKPATRRNHLRQTMEDSLAKRNLTPRGRGTTPTAPPTQYRTTRVHEGGNYTSNSPATPVDHIRRALQERVARSGHKLEHTLLSRSMESLDNVGRASPSRKTTPPSSQLYLHGTGEQRRATLPSLRSVSHARVHNTEPKRTSSIEHLPTITHTNSNSSSSRFKPIALMSVDGERENLRVERLRNTHGRSTSSTGRLAMTRSKSLQSMRADGHTSSLHPHKRNSVDSQVTSGRDPSLPATPTGSCVPLLPSVVSPTLSSTPPKYSFPSPNKPSPSHHHQQMTGNTTCTNNNSSSGNNSRSGSKSQLSVVTEEKSYSSSSSSDRTQTDKQLMEVFGGRGAVGVAGPVDPPNVIVNYATKDSSATPLSPIWGMMQLHKTESDTSSDYISSYIGAMTPFPHDLISPDHTYSNKRGGDSGQGESDEDRRHCSSDSSEEGEEEVPPANREVLRWKRGRVLGKGAFGKVCEGLMDNAKLIAVKEIELDMDTTREKAELQFNKIQLEVDILRSLHHRNIVHYYGASMDSNTVYIFMEFISGGSLQSVLKRFGALSENTIAHYTRQMSKGLDYLHNNGIIHRDIKGANIMVTSKGVVKLIDFGCAKKHCEDLSEAFHSTRGTPFWMSPEIIKGQSYGKKSDIWSLGCTIHEMAVTKPPWGELPPEAAMFQIGIGQSVPLLPDNLSVQLKDIFRQCISRDPRNRPTAKELLLHPFLTISDSSIVKVKEKQNRKSKKRH